MWEEATGAAWTGSCTAGAGGPMTPCNTLTKAVCVWWMCWRFVHGRYGAERLLKKHLVAAGVSTYAYFYRSRRPSYVLRNQQPVQQPAPAFHTPPTAHRLCVLPVHNQVPRVSTGPLRAQCFRAIRNRHRQPRRRVGHAREPVPCRAPASCVPKLLAEAGTGGAVAICGGGGARQGGQGVVAAARKGPGH